MGNIDIWKTMLRWIALEGTSTLCGTVFRFWSSLYGIHCVLNVCELTCFRWSVSLAYADLLCSLCSVRFITSLYYLMLEVTIRCGSKGKVHPRTGHEGPEEEQIYSSTLPSTSALDGGWVVNATRRPLYPRKRPGNHWVWGWVGPRDGLERSVKYRLRQDWIPEPSSP